MKKLEKVKKAYRKIYNFIKKEIKIKTLKNANQLREKYRLHSLQFSLKFP